MPACLNTKKRLWTALTGFLFCLFLACPAQALDYTWIGGAFGDWDVAANWDLGGGFPGVGDTATFNAATNVNLNGDQTVDGITTNAASITFTGSGANSLVTGTLTIGAGTTITLSNTDTMNITGAFGLGANNVVLDGSGTFFVQGNVTGTGGLTINSGTFRLGADNLLPDTLALTLGAGGTFSLNNFDETIGSISGSGTLSLGFGELTFGNASNTSFSGNVTASGFGGATINKQGSGSFTVPAGADIVTGIVYFNIYGGAFILNRNWNLWFVEVHNGGTMAGDGSVGSAGILVYAGGTLSPGNSPGKLATADALALEPGSTLAIELNGVTAGTQYDQVTVSIGCDLAGYLCLSLGYTPAISDSYMIVENFGSRWSTFAGLPQGGVINTGGYAFQIDYQGGSGNDVVLTCLGLTPEPTPTPTPTPEPEPEPEPDVDPPAAPQVTQGSSPSPVGSLNGPALSWPHVAGSNFYRIYRANCPTCTKTQVGRVPGTSFTDESALAGQVYYYWVKTENGGGLSDYSDWMAAWRYEQNPGRAGDFNGDGVMDLLWWDPATGRLSIWYLSGGVVQGVSSPGEGLDISQWLLINTGDFNNDGIWDLLWWNPESGMAQVWYMSAAPSASSGGMKIQATSDAGDITGNVTLSYLGDLNGDGRVDLVWRDYSTGQVTIWLMGEDGKPSLNGPPTLAEGVDDDGRPGITDSLEWTLRGLFDMNADGKADVVWQHASDGRVVVWSMDGAQATGYNQYQREAPDNWRIAGLGDLNADGRGDIVWRNDSSGQVQVWLMTSPNSKAEPAYEARDLAMGDSPAAWQVKAIGDFCEPGCDDVYCKHSDTGAARITTLEGGEYYPAVE